MIPYVKSLQLLTPRTHFGFDIPPTLHLRPPELFPNLSLPCIKIDANLGICLRPPSAGFGQGQLEAPKMELIGNVFPTFLRSFDKVSYSWSDFDFRNQNNFH